MSPAANHNRSPLPPLLWVRAFEAVGRTGSMRKGAEDIGLTHTVVSRHLHHLESWLGIKLVVAGPRGAALTPEGARFHRVVAEALSSIGEAAAELRPVHDRRTIKLWCMPGLATRWLAPRLSAIGEIVPGAEIVLRAIDRTPDFDRDEADLMILFTAQPEQYPHATLLLQPGMFPVVSTAWLAANTPPTTLLDLARSPLIHEESHGQWQAWFTAAGLDRHPALAGPRLWDANLGLDAAIAGQGIALATMLTAGDELASGRLVRLFDKAPKLGGYYLIQASGQRADSRLHALRTWLISTMKASAGSGA